MAQLGGQGKRAGGKRGEEKLGSVLGPTSGRCDQRTQAAVPGLSGRSPGRPGLGWRGERGEWCLRA